MLPAWLTARIACDADSSSAWIFLKENCVDRASLRGRGVTNLEDSFLVLIRVASSWPRDHVPPKARIQEQRAVSRGAFSDLLSMPIAMQFSLARGPLKFLSDKASPEMTFLRT